MKKSIFLATLYLALNFVSSAQAQTMSPTETYLAYHKAMIAASKSEDVFFAYFTSGKVAEYRALPAKDKAFAMEMSQALFADEKDLKVVSETIKGTKATVKTEYCSEGKRGTSDVSFVLEGAAWKIGKSHSKTGLKPCN